MSVDRLLENFWRLFDLVLTRRFVFAGVALGGSASMMTYGTMNSDEVAAILLKLNAEIFDRAGRFSEFAVTIFDVLLRNLG